jgi:hypothetical protein
VVSARQAKSGSIRTLSISLADFAAQLLPLLVVTEEDSQGLGNREDKLPVREGEQDGQR